MIGKGLSLVSSVFAIVLIVSVLSGCQPAVTDSAASSDVLSADTESTEPVAQQAILSEVMSTAVIWLPGLIVMLVLVAGSAFFSGSETALFYLSREDLRRMQTGTSGERLAAQLMRNPDRLLTVVLFWNLVINLSYFMVSLIVAKRLIDSNHSSLAGVISFGGLVGMILCGEVAPKSMAVIFRKQIAVLASWPLAIAARILDPALPFLGTTTRALRRAMWPTLKLEPYLEFDDIERAVESSELGVEIVRLEQQILGRILDLSEMHAEEIMRPRGTYKVWQPPLSLEDLRNVEDPSDVVLIAGEDGDTVEKAIALQELSHLPELHLETIADDVVFIPWCGSVAAALTQLRRKFVSVASVVNEYGETVGIITEGDILDTLLNPESSRTRRLLDRDPVVKTRAGYLVDGLTTLRYLGERLGFDYEPGDEGLLTVTSLLHEELQRFPAMNDQCIWQGYRFTVKSAGGPGEAIKVQVSKIVTANEVVE